MPRRYDETMSAFKKQKTTPNNPTAAPAAMKGSAKARTVIAAPVKAGGTGIKGLCKRAG